MRKFFAPLIVFALGQGLMLILFLFMPAIGTAGSQLQADTAGWTGWGWSWVTSSVELLVYIMVEGVTLFFVGLVFVKGRHN